MILYARDLQRAVALERQRSADLERALAKMTEMQAQLERALALERERARQVELAHQDAMGRLLQASVFRDHETGAHLLRVSEYSLLLARTAGLSEECAGLIAAAAPMHDVGKVGVPDSILLKPGRLTADERSEMENHTLIGADLLEGSRSSLLQIAARVALTHHERWDGSGYPNRLKGEEIPLEGRIVILADQYDALRTARTYKPAFSHERTCSIILEGDGRTRPDHFDPMLLEMFAGLTNDFERIHNQLQDETG
jgi:putative two-component system response regulator